MFRIDYINYLSTTKYQRKIPDYVNNNNIPGTSQLLRSTRYQVSRRKRDRERKKKKRNETKTNVHAQIAGRVLKGQGCCLLVVRSVL